MQIAVISDLHLGKKNGLDRFSRAAAAEERLVKMLQRLERAVDRIVLLGDVFETLRGATPGPRARELQDAMEAYPQIARRIVDDRRYRMVFGNHDIVAGTALGAPEFLIERDHDTTIAFFHGHQMDRLARGNAPFSRLGVWLGGVLERVGVGVTHRVDQLRGGVPDEGIRDPHVHEQGAIAIAKELGADVVVNGHTHRPVRLEIENQLYLNSGTCLAGRREVVMIDTASGTFELHEERDT